MIFAVVAAPESFTSARGAALAAPAALFQFGFGMTPATSTAPIEVLLVPTKSTLMVPSAAPRGSSP